MKKLLLIGAFISSIYSYSQDGSLDLSFGTNGKVVTSINNGSDIAYSIKLQQDGKIIVAGMTTSSITGKDFVCIRYNSNGSLDSTFANGGIFTYDLQTGSDDVAYSVDIQSDGKIILAGYSDDGSNKVAALVRLTSDGILDTTFGSSGKVFTDFITGRADEIKVVKIHQLTGNIVVGGTSSVTSTNSQAVIVRYNSSGALDNTFNSTGKVLLPNASGNGTYYYVIEDLAIKSNGKISAVGWINQQGLSWSANHYGCRLNSNGTLDTSFSTDGVIVTNGGFNGDDKSFSMILNSDDSFLFAGGGYLTDLQYDFFLGLYNATGSTAQGKASFNFATLNKDIIYGTGVDSAGKIVLVGSSVASVSSSTFGLARVNSDYTVDSSFGTSGKVTTTFGTNTTNEAFDMAIQSDDKIIAVGYTGNDIAIARYNGNVLSSESFQNDRISVFPNPTSQILYVESNLGIEEIEIFDSLGRSINSYKLEGNKIDVSFLSNGIYFLKSKNYIIKFIKN
ncbi:T9SS type A sorting domain-containing protein [Flavobacterium haoranii]|uniref:Delta-60 repeat domain-containing protein/Por secretion system C-terminal sorting domain-containing protein n=1 Tax=Flavobacterium haoranii TaxID=683124 RepID=A0A1M6LY37_9FLAO|nr:T9SS type A sorting domain-containing protein [Flavobacterium haoranii]SHJ76086.1 delta-60 repeat domain-containing protein/Por secretion system C-terminal sorting domain-containing protein [Flavobacterium haoranii]